MRIARFMAELIVIISVLIIVISVVVLLAGTVSAQGRDGKDWILWSQHMSTAGPLWWRPEAGPVTNDECRALLKKVSGVRKVKFTGWYDTSPAVLEKNFGTPANPEKGTWIACWPAAFDFDRDLVEK